jgi:hypothetical protein
MPNVDEMLLDLLVEQEMEKRAEQEEELTPLEKLLLVKLAREEKKKTYPISRALTSPYMGVASGVEEAALLRALGVKPGRALLGGAATGAAGAGSAVLSRKLYSWLRKKHPTAAKVHNVLSLGMLARARKGRQAKGTLMKGE